MAFWTVFFLRGGGGGDRGDNIDMWTQYVDDKNYDQNKSN